MARSVHNEVLDAALSELATGTIMTACSQEPVDRTGAVTTYALADVAPSFTGPADGDSNGRKIGVDQKTAVDVDVTGTADHIAI